MARGGARAGAGRKPGALTKKTRELADSIGASGDTPLDTLNELRVWAMNEFRRAVELSLTSDDDGKVVLARAEAAKVAEFAADIANKQAPFVHPKLAAVEMTGKDGGAIQMESTLDLSALTLEQKRALASIKIGE